MRVRPAFVRALAFTAAAGALAATIASVGWSATLPALARVAGWLPLLVSLEGGIVALNALALAAFYRAGGAVPPARPFWRAVYLGNVMVVCLPAGRLLAEAWKAVRLSRWSGGPTAAASAVGLQAATLLGNAAIALVTLVGVALRCGWTWPTQAVGAFTLGMIGAGLGISLAGRARAGHFLGARFAFARAQGGDFDAAFARTGRALWVAAGWESAARLLQLAQVTVLLRALGHAVGPVRALATHGLVLTGSALGDMLPAQVGATDALLAMAAGRIALPTSDALALTLCLHGAQVVLALLAGAAALALSDGIDPATEPA